MASLDIPNNNLLGHALKIITNLTDAIQQANANRIAESSPVQQLINQMDIGILNRLNKLNEFIENENRRKNEIRTDFADTYKTLVSGINAQVKSNDILGRQYCIDLYTKPVKLTTLDDYFTAYPGIAAAVKLFQEEMLIKNYRVAITLEHCFKPYVCVFVFKC